MAVRGESVYGRLRGEPGQQVSFRPRCPHPPDWHEPPPFPDFDLSTSSSELLSDHHHISATAGWVVA